MKKNPEQPKIAIIGAGPAGMSAAWFLKRNGYTNVRVFEKIERVGGKCLTFEYEGRQFDMAAHEMLAGYGDVMDIANALKVPWTGYQNVLVYDRGNKKYMDMMTATQAGGYGKLQVVWASLRYTWKLLTRYRKFSKPGSGFANAPPELLQPLSSWLKQQRLEALTETILFVMKVQGFGRLDQIPAAYFVKFQGFGNWISNVLHVAGLTQKWPRVFKHGFQSLWEALAKETDVRLNTEIHSVKRHSIAGGNVAKVEIEYGDDNQKEMFDQVILSCPLDMETLTSIGLNMAPQETELFSKVRYVEFVTTACRVEGIPAGVVGTIPLPPLLDYTGYIKIYDDSDMTIFFNLSPSESYDKEDILDNIKAQVAELPEQNGVPVNFKGEESQHGWRYFPHVSLADFSGGFYDQLESLQGFEQTFYSSSLLGFETVGNTVAYSRYLVDRYFPPVR
ncbi:MAG: FAD-dependent oxidoreductase [Woeseiaceae bacterium]